MGHETTDKFVESELERERHLIDELDIDRLELEWDRRLRDERDFMSRRCGDSD